MNTNKKFARQESDRQFTLKEQRIANMLNHTNQFSHISVENDKPEGPIFILMLTIVGFIGGIVVIIVLAKLVLIVLRSWGVM